MGTRKKSNADVEEVVRAVCYISDEASLRRRTSDWGVEDFLYAIERLEIDQPSSRREPLRDLYRVLRSERDAEEKLVDANATNALRHFELSQKLDELKKPHWTVLPNFWLTFVSAVAAVLAAWLAWITLKR